MTISRWLLNILGDGDSTTSLGSLFQCLVPPSRNVFPDVQIEPPGSQFVLMASGPGTGHHQEGLAPSSFCHPADTCTY